MRRSLAASVVLALAVLAVPLGSAGAATLGDLRGELEALAAELGRLRGDLVRGDAVSARIDGDTLRRIDVMESALARLTAQAEELDFRIRRVVVDATNRLGDLEFRLVELEGGDVTQLGITAPLGGLDLAAPGPTAPLAPSASDPAGPLMAAGEQAAFEAAALLLNQGRSDEAAAALGDFIDAFPAGPRTEEAMLLLGAAHRARGALGDSARSFLDLFTANPEGPHAPTALLALGEALSDLGEAVEACIMFEELSIRFPQTDAATRGREFFARLNCG